MKPERQDYSIKVEKFYRRMLHWLELVIAGFTLLVLIVSLCLEGYRMATVDGYFVDLTGFLHNILNIVVGLEFVRMLVDMTPATTMEVLIMATARYIILNHNSHWTLLVGVICIGALFAIRRFLIRPKEMKEELVEIE